MSKKGRNIPRRDTILVRDPNLGIWGAGRIDYLHLEGLVRGQTLENRRRGAEAAAGGVDRSSRRWRGQRGKEGAFDLVGCDIRQTATFTAFALLLLAAAASAAATSAAAATNTNTCAANNFRHERSLQVDVAEPFRRA